MAAGALVAAGVVAVTTLPAFAATSCNVTYAASPWTESPGVGGYTANVTILNSGDACANTSCYDSQLGPVAAQVPLSLTEIGENDCAHGFVDTLMNWADSHKWARVDQ